MTLNGCKGIRPVERNAEPANAYRLLFKAEYMPLARSISAGP